jgi:hypothetical protein
MASYYRAVLKEKHVGLKVLTEKCKAFAEGVKTESHTTAVEVNGSLSNYSIRT